MELGEVLAVAGLWDGAVAAIDAGLARFGGSELPGVLDLQAARAAYRAYDPKLIGDYDADLPRLLGLVEGREDDDSSGLRWVLAAIGACQDMPRAEVLRLIGPPGQSWTVNRGGRESSLIGQAGWALVLVEAFDQAAMVGAALREEGRGRGSLLAMIAGVGYARRDREPARRAADGRGAAAGGGRPGERERTEPDGADHRPPPLRRRAGRAVRPGAARRDGRGGRAAGALRPDGQRRDAARSARRGAGGARRPGGRGGRAARGRRAVGTAALRAALQQLALAAGAGAAARTSATRRCRWRVRSCGWPRRSTRRRRGPSASPSGRSGCWPAARRGSSGCASRRRPWPGRALAVERARSLTELGAALRRGNQRSEARDRLREASDLAQGTGAERLEARIAEEMRVAGAKPRRRAISGPDSLTPAERRVALAAATGATNREIAQDLFVSLRTVEMHLSNTYRKLGTPKRGDLADALGEEEAPEVSL